MGFTIREFSHGETVGEKLLAMRREAKLTLREAAQLTKIRKSYIKAFEENAYGDLPETLYARNFLKAYVHLLGGDEDYFVERFEKERGTCDFTQAMRLPRRRTRPWEFLVASRFMKMALLLILALAVVAYLGSQLRTITAPPQLTVFEPTDGYVTSEATLPVRGQVEKDAAVKVDEVEVILNKDNTFETEVILQRGVNIITITGAKRYSREATIYRRVILEQN
ncbi:helix-turn-helix domain-containing protein [Patescibacteria group bacterium]|nr:helix-turn-helix domain-containing protein [Patescibacteria group bacterium]